MEFINEGFSFYFYVVKDDMSEDVEVIVCEIVENCC